MNIIEDIENDLFFIHYGSNEALQVYKSCVLSMKKIYLLSTYGIVNIFLVRSCSKHSRHVVFFQACVVGTVVY